MRRVGGILVGGQATRLGAIPKGNLRLGGKTLLERTINLLAPFCDDVLLLGHRTAYDYLGLKTIDDRIGQGGPVTGIASALALTQSDLLVTPCDLPFLTSDVLARLINHELRVPTACRGPQRTHPLIAHYPSNAVAVVAECAEHQQSAHQAFKACCGEWVDFRDERPFMNVNTEADWVEARRVYQLLAQDV
ncbi:MAG: molybdenum cofactor guanylyltransferase [Bradymonadia bacterium]